MRRHDRHGLLLPLLPHRPAAARPLRDAAAAARRRSRKRCWQHTAPSAGAAAGDGLHRGKPDDASSPPSLSRPFTAPAAARGRRPARRRGPRPGASRGRSAPIDRNQLQRGFQVFRKSARAAIGATCWRSATSPSRAVRSSPRPGQGAGGGIRDHGRPNAEGGKRPGLPADRWPSPFANDQEARAPMAAHCRRTCRCWPRPAARRSFPWWILNYFTHTGGRPGLYPRAAQRLRGARRRTSRCRRASTTTSTSRATRSAWRRRSATARSSTSDGTPPDGRPVLRDVSAFLMWVAEPHLVSRKEPASR